MTLHANKLRDNIYVFSGLGADERVFQFIDFTGYSVTFIQWIVPRENELIESYTKRLLSQITDNKPILIGLSFGGIMAIEVAKQIEVEKIILISSAKISDEIPLYYRLFGKLRIHRIIPYRLMKRPNFITDWLFGTNSDFDRNILKDVLSDTNLTFLKWAIDKIVTWENKNILNNIFHIHGTKDNLLPIKFIGSHTKVLHGGHLMVLNKAAEITQLINNQLV